MSENRIAASTPSRATGCSVISHASSGVRQQVRKSWRSRMRAVLGQVASRLPHDPDRRALDRLAPARAQEQRILAGPRCRAHRRPDLRVRHRRSPARAAAAAIVVSMSAGVCAAERKFASNCDGARKMPRASMRLEEPREPRRVAPRRAVPVVHPLGREEQRPHRATRAIVHGAPSRAIAAASPASSAAPSALEPRVELRIGGDHVERREARGHRERVARQRARPGRSGPAGDTRSIRSRRPPYAPTGQSAADDLAERRQVGPDAVALLRAAARHAEAGHHLVEDQQRARRRVHSSRSPSQEPGPGHDDAHVADDRLDDDRGDRRRGAPRRPRARSSRSL